MSKQFAVLQGLRALVAAAVPDADIRGFEGDTTKPQRIGAGGTIIGHPGDPGDPDVDLSPLCYNYEHVLYLEVTGPGGKAGPALDAMLKALGEAIRANRSLGGLCCWLEAQAPDRNDRTTDAVQTTNWATVPIVAQYSTPDPLA